MLLKANMIGRVGRDAEVRSTQQGKEFVTFSCATNVKSKGQEKTIWASCFMPGRTNLAPYIKKGQLIYVDGQQDIDLYDGKPQLKINVSEIRFLTPKQQGEQQRPQVSYASNQHPAAKEIRNNPSDIPF